MRLQAVQHRHGDVDLHAKRVGDGGGQQMGLRDRGQGHEEGSVHEVVLRPVGHLDGHPGLARPSRPGQRDQTVVAEQPPGLRQLPTPPDQRRQPGGEVVPSDGPKGREVGGEPLDLELEDPLGLGEVLQPVLPQVADLHLLRQACQRRVGGLGEQDLPAVAGRGDAGRPVDVQSDVVVTAEDPFAGVQAHPHLDRCFLVPAVTGELLLGPGGRLDRIGCVGEGHEERVAFGRDLGPPELGEYAPQDRGVLAADGCIASLPQPSQEIGGALDVGEQERDGPGREPRCSRHPLPLCSGRP